MCDFIEKWKKLDPKRNERNIPMRWYTEALHPSWLCGRPFCDLCGKWDENGHDKSQMHITRLKRTIQCGYSKEMRTDAINFRREKGIKPPPAPAPLSPSESSSDDESTEAHGGGG